MKLWCFDDEGKKFRTGRAIQERALARGWDCRLFTRSCEVGHDAAYAFMRIQQWAPKLERCKAIAAELMLTRPNLTVIPDWDQIAWYEDKVSQAHDLAAWMPATCVLNGMNAVDEALAVLGLPLVSKSSEGSSCANVRFVQTREQAEAEARAVFEGDGIPMRLGGEGRGSRQKGYLLWQKFLAGNAYMYRVGVCGRLKWMFREGNRPGLPFASGSGLYTPIQELDAETRSLFDAATTFCAATGQKWAGLDYARDPDSGEWMLLETTLAWGMLNPISTIGCMLFDERGEPTGRKGDRLWDALLDEIEAGQFGC